MVQRISLQPDDQTYLAIGIDKFTTTYLDLCSQNNMGITRVRQSEDSSELIHGEFSNVPDLQFRRLCHETEYLK